MTNSKELYQTFDQDSYVYNPELKYLLFNYSDITNEDLLTFPNTLETLKLYYCPFINDLSYISNKYPNLKYLDIKNYDEKYEEAYTAYLEILDKYVLNSIYKKANAGTATDFQRKALSQYYGIVQLKENEFIEYKYRKQN